MGLQRGKQVYHRARLEKASWFKGLTPDAFTDHGQIERHRSR